MFSFYATKNVTIGEGGTIATEDPELAGLAAPDAPARDELGRLAPVPARRPVALQFVDEVGYKANLTDLQAAIGRAATGRAWTAGTGAGSSWPPGTTPSYA